MIVTLSALCLALGPTQNLQGQDLSGTWVLTVNLDAGSGDATFTFEQDGNRLTGTYSGVFGEQPVTGTITADTVQFSFNTQAGTIAFKGQLEDGILKGTCEYGQLGTGTFSGKRREP